MTDIIGVDSEALHTAAEIISDHGIVAVPTPRWYMLCCRADNPVLIQRIFESKGRPQTKPPHLNLAEKTDVLRYALTNAQARKFIDRFWPGEVSIRLPWADKFVSRNPDISKSFEESSAVFTNVEGCLRTITEYSHRPMATTSLGRSHTTYPNTDPPAATVSQVREFIRISQLQIDAIIDDNDCVRSGTSMTLINFTGTRPYIEKVGSIDPKGFSLSADES